MLGCENSNGRRKALLIGAVPQPVQLVLLQNRMLCCYSLFSCLLAGVTKRAFHREIKANPSRRSDISLLYLHPEVTSFYRETGITRFALLPPDPHNVGKGPARRLPTCPTIVKVTSANHLTAHSTLQLVSRVAPFCLPRNSQ